MIIRLPQPSTGGRALVARLQLRVCAKLRGDVAVRGTVWIHGGGELLLGNGVVFDGVERGIELYVRRHAVLTIGDGVTIGSGTSIEAYRRIAVGPGVRIGSSCKLLDNNLHSLASGRHVAPESIPVVIEQAAVLDDYVIILPGARVGSGAHVGRGAVVSRRVPAGAKVSGRAVHPARVNVSAS